MIRYDLKCTNDHQYESWFQSIDAFDKLKERNLLTCEQCGTSNVSKAIIAPNISPSSKKIDKPTYNELVIEDVGKRFVSEVRAIYNGEAEVRNITGIASRHDVKELIEDGINVLVKEPTNMN